MGRRSILLKSISCQGVKSFNLFKKPSLYAIISIFCCGDGQPGRKQQQQKTPADLHGGENPEWDHATRFDLDDGDFQDQFLEFEIMAQRILLLLGDKLIGKSRVPIADLTAAQPHPAGVVRHVSYQVQSSNGKANGVLSFSYSLNLPEIEFRLRPPLDRAIPSAPQLDYYPPQSAPTDGLNPPDCYCQHNQPLPLDPVIYYPPPPPRPAAGYYPPPDRAVYPPVVMRDTGYLSSPAFGDRGYYAPPLALTSLTAMPAFEAYNTPPASWFGDAPPQDSCDYWNGNSNRGWMDGYG